MCYKPWTVWIRYFWCPTIACYIKYFGLSILGIPVSNYDNFIQGFMLVTIFDDLMMKFFIPSPTSVTNINVGKEISCENDWNLDLIVNISQWCMRMRPSWIRMSIKIHSTITSTFSLLMQIKAKHNPFFRENIKCSATTMTKFKSEIRELEYSVWTWTGTNEVKQVKQFLYEFVDLWFKRQISNSFQATINDFTNLLFIISCKYFISPGTTENINFSIESCRTWILYSCIRPDEKLQSRFFFV